MTHKQYKAYTLWLLIVTVTALVVTAAMLSLKGSAEAKLAAAASGPVTSGPVTSGPVMSDSLPEEPGIAYYTPNPASSQENSETALKSKYFVTLYQGKIGVFKEGRTSPVLVKEVSAYLLPEEDLELLKQGLPAQDLSEARKILEDYD